LRENDCEGAKAEAVAMTEAAVKAIFARLAPIATYVEAGGRDGRMKLLSTEGWECAWKSTGRLVFMIWTKMTHNLPEAACAPRYNKNQL
jgi:hypothetical protein